jgi:hypothetical protein
LGASGAVRSQAESERESGEVGCRGADAGRGKETSSCEANGCLLPRGFRWKSTLPAQEESAYRLLNFFLKKAFPC